MGRRSRNVAACILGALMIAAVAAVSGGGVARARPAAQSAQAVAMLDNTFQPATISVPVGTTITWVNNGQAVHTATANSGAWDSGLVRPGGSFGVTVTTPGTIPYRCTVHPGMDGTIVVQAAAAAPAPRVPAAQATAAAVPARPAAGSPPGSRTATTGTALLPSTGTGIAGSDTSAPGWLLGALSLSIALLGGAGVVLSRRAARAG